MNTDEHFIKAALEEAEKSLNLTLLPVGAVLVLENKIVAKAHKQDVHSYHTDHAEIMLLREYFQGKNLRRKNQHIALYTTLEPCMMCLGTILHLPISRLVYAAKDPYGGACCILNHPQLLPYRHQKNQIELVSCVCEDLAKMQLKKFLAITEEPFYQDRENLLVQYILS